MCPFGKKMLGRKGSFLIEILAAVLVLSVGILTVMQSYAGQQRAALTNQNYTRSIISLSDQLGALWAGLEGPPQPVSGKSPGAERYAVDVHLKSLLNKDKDLGLKEGMFAIDDERARKSSSLVVRTYVEDRDAAKTF